MLFSNALLPLRSLAAHTAAACFTCALLASASASADTMLSNLNQSPLANDSGQFVGQAFTTGTTAMILTAATVQVNSSPKTPKLELEAANANGTVGATLYTFTFASSSTLNTYSVLDNFTANNFLLAANTTYFLVLSDFNSKNQVHWNYAASTAYTALNGFTLPTTHTSFVSTTDNSVSKSGTYYNLSDDPAIFSLSASPVIATTPEPSSVVLLGTGILGLTGAARRRFTKI